MKSPALFLICNLLLTDAAFHSLHAQSVIVTAQFDTNQLVVGQSTTLRLFAQVTPNLQTNADRIFSWYIDLLNTNGSVATGNYGALSKPASDNDPLTSSIGSIDGANLRGIYDTFLNTPGAGVNDPVLLVTVPVVAVAPGQTQFSVSAGTGVAGLDNDFIVAPLGGGDPWLGGDYSLTRAALTVLIQDCNIQLQISRLDAGSPTARLQLQFTPCPGRTNTVVTRSAVDSGSWVPLPGAPHNSGTVIVTNTVPQQFFRVQVN